MPRPRPPSLPDVPVVPQPQAPIAPTQSAEPSPEATTDPDTEPAAEPAAQAKPEAEAEPQPEPKTVPQPEPASDRVYQVACPAVIQGLVEAEMAPPLSEGICGEHSPLIVTGGIEPGPHDPALQRR